MSLSDTECNITPFEITPCHTLSLPTLHHFPDPSDIDPSRLRNNNKHLSRTSTLVPTSIGTT